MTREEDEYRELRQLEPGRRRAWLRAHCPEDAPWWWLGLVECAEFDASVSRPIPTEERKWNVEFLVELIELAVEVGGMPPSYAAFRLAAKAIQELRAGLPVPDLPEAVTPDGVVRRALASFRLTEEQALAVAARLRTGLYDDQPPDAETLALMDINRLLPDLEVLVGYVRDQALAARARRWVGLAAALET